MNITSDPVADDSVQKLSLSISSSDVVAISYSRTSIVAYAVVRSEPANDAVSSESRHSSAKF